MIFDHIQNITKLIQLVSHFKAFTFLFLYLQHNLPGEKEDETKSTNKNAIRIKHHGWSDRGRSRVCYGSRSFCL